MGVASQRIALVTGASRGIGRALARELAAHGHDTVLVARNTDELEALAAELRQEFGTRAWVMRADLARREAPAELYAEIEAGGLQIDLLVNNAGFGVFGAFTDTQLPRDLELLEVNVVALTQLTKLFLRSMVARGAGRIINVASTGAFQPGPLMATYYASKAYVLSFSEAIAEELAGTGVTVSALCPGVTRSSFPERAGMQRSRLLQMPLLRMDAETVARVGYRQAMHGRRVIVPGLINKLLVFLVRISPRGVVTRFVHWLMQRR